MQIVNEIAKRYANKCPHGVWRDDVELAFLDGVKFAQRWIPVEDELPKYKGENFAIIGKHKKFEFPIMIHIESHEDVLSIADEFTHWRPIEYPLL